MSEFLCSLRVWRFALFVPVLFGRESCCGHWRVHRPQLCGDPPGARCAFFLARDRRLPTVASSGCCCWRTLPCWLVVCVVVAGVVLSPFSESVRVGIGDGRPFATGCLETRLQTKTRTLWPRFSQECCLDPRAWWHHGETCVDLLPRLLSMAARLSRYSFQRKSKHAIYFSSLKNSAQCFPRSPSKSW